MDKFILDGHTPIEEPDVIKWAMWYESANRYVGKTDLPDGSYVSTVFLGLDHNFSIGLPILFETMVFGGKHDSYQERYSTWEEAELGHQRAVEMCLNDEK